MHAKDAIKNAYDFSRMVLSTYVSDLSDAELLNRPCEGCNHVAWQLGHLISSEVMLLESVAPGHGIELPEGFAETHGKENVGSDDAAEFRTKDEYLQYFEQLKASAFAAIDAQTDEDLAKDPPERLAGFCPNVAGVFMLIATHPMMHVGQFVPVRRNLGKAVVI
ncbi:DinB superfamily protein [Rubripirellula amarantea]|uniref:DinB superfamily protein n=1 Tax=Rubripirellula amarantea TaxID=2527999 RepID=A0A5C5WPR5_9BACT|nr:DinB family protein [Rubripirellula amarantea]TWT52658.1 DinB superfamily protein [Rubripirellula amarantea]